MDEPTTRSCPHCGAEVPALPECQRCGVVFAKYRPRPRPAGTVEVTSSPPASRPLAPWLAVLGLVIVVAVVISRRGDQPQSATAPPPTVTPQPVPQAAQEPVPQAAREPVLQADREPATTDDLWSQDDESGLEMEPQPEPAVASTTDVEALTSLGYYWLENASGFRSGLELAAAESRPMAVYFYTDWCGYCREFESELLTRARVEDFTKYLVKVKINPEAGPQERQIADRYGVRGYPSFFVQASATARPHKVRRKKQVGGERVMQTPSEFVATLRDAIG